MTVRSPYPDVEVAEIPLASFVLERAEELADKAALIDGPSGRVLTYSALAGGVRRVAAGLSARGFGAGDVFAIFLPNVPEYAVAFHAVAAVGGATTTINPLYTVDELAFQLADAGARYLLTIPPFLDRALEAAGNAGVEEVFVLGEASGGDGGPAVTPFPELLAAGDAPPAVDIAPHDVVALPYSSGTTGLPKGVMLTHRNLVANLSQCAPVIRVGEDDVIIGVLPFFHIYGMTVVMNLALQRGATVVTMPRFDLGQFLHLLQHHRVTRAYVVPPIILALAKQPMVDEYDLSALEVVLSGAAPLGAELATECGRRLGCMVTQGYGLTETSPVTHATPEEPGRNRPGAVGVLLPNTEGRVVDPATGEDAPSGETGEVWIRGPQVMRGYLNNPEATEATVDDGWLRTGDLGHTDDEGYFYLVDRLKELIKYKGFQVPPAELEALLVTHPAVADVAVIGTPDEEAGEVPKAYVVLSGEATAEELMDFVAGRVASYKRIRAVEVIDTIPKSASGKILRRKLVEAERAR